MANGKKQLTYKYPVIATIVWSFLLALSLGWNIYNEQEQTHARALEEARANFNKDMAFRLWATSHGGLYVPPTEASPPNPYLAHIPSRDVVTTTGQELTLLKPAYALRQLMEANCKLYGVKGIITSLKPLNPKNEPDQWARKALNRFAAGEEELSEIVDIDGKPHLRLIRPMITRERCLKCHAHQGYQVGDVRGGVGVSVPMGHYFALRKRAINFISLSHALIWLCGLIGVWVASGRLRQRFRQLQESRSYWTATFDASGDIITILDLDKRIVRANRTAGEKLGLHPSGLEGRFCYEAFQEADKKCRDCHLEATIREKQVHTVEVEYSNLGMTCLVTTAPLFDNQGKLMGVVHSAKDVSELKKANQRLRQSQKMEAIGTLAGGIAHDFNNILSAINGYTELSLLEVEPGTSLCENLNQVAKAGGRAGELVNQILSYSRQTDQPRIPIQFNLIIKEALKLLRSSIPVNIMISHDLECSAMVMAEPTELHQVVMNLCTNAFLAMADKGGEMKIELSELELDELSASACPDLESGNYLRLLVSDTGAGMSSEVQEHIFEPYFTTREKGKGTGLGLAVVHGIVAASGGAVTVYSEAGQGTIFKVYLPVVVAGEELAVVEEAGTGIYGGHEQIMLVDDEDNVLEVGRRMLEQLGYQVSSFNDPSQALLALGEGLEIDLLITDMAMPEMTGAELVRRSRLLWPELPVILCTGFSKQATSVKTSELMVDGFIMKPFLLITLATEVRRVLDDKG